MTVVIIEQSSDISGLARMTAGFSRKEDLRALVVGDESLANAASACFAAVTWIDAKGSELENFSSGAGSLLASLQPVAIVGASRPATRAIAGVAAAALGAVLVSSVVQVEQNGSAIIVTRSVYNDYLETDAITGPAVLLVSPVNLEAEEAAADAAGSPIDRVDVASAAFIAKTGETVIEAAGEETAERVVGLGFGARGAQAFAAGHELAKALGAEIGASMVMVDNTTLMPGKRYIGLSGITISPRLYVACGISGAAQHLIGMRNAGCVVVINADPEAKFFNHADYGIVGKIEDVAPAIIRALE